jgi:hypothetical protein
MPVRYFTLTVPACILLLLAVSVNLPRHQLTMAAWTDVAIGVIQRGSPVFGQFFR